jgi:hypothetical protein
VSHALSHGFVITPSNNLSHHAAHGVTQEHTVAHIESGEDFNDISGKPIHPHTFVANEGVTVAAQIDSDDTMRRAHGSHGERKDRDIQGDPMHQHHRWSFAHLYGMDTAGITDIDEVMPRLRRHSKPSIAEILLARLKTTRTNPLEGQT